MMPSLVFFFHLPLVHVALSGFVAGVTVDLHAFLSFKDWKDFVGYRWDIALFRGCQGMMASVLTAGGLSLVS